MTNIVELKNSFLAGKSTLEPNELAKLLDETQNAIKEIVNQNLLQSDDLIHNIYELLKAIIEGEFAREFMEKISEENFHKLGIALVDKLETGKIIEDKVKKELAYLYLNLFRFSEFLRKIENSNSWTKLVSKIIKLTNFNTRQLFKQRVKQYQSKTLFGVIRGEKIVTYSWNDASSKVNLYTNALLSLIEKRNDKPRIAFLMENSLEMALLDIACLNSGIVNVMIPANSVPQHISFILNQTKCDFILVQNEKQLAKLKSVKSDLKYLIQGVIINGSSAEEWVVSLRDLVKNCSQEKEDSEFDLPIDSMATIMYTSGTTGEPKGIIFTQKNIVFKRFCRAIALPEINDKDSFLSYLPLYHTFGRWLELIGTIFWGATYSFMENPSAETMIANMRLVKPTIFISIPKKWIQLYEIISSKVDIELDDEETIKTEADDITGGKLKWGLSAAGYLSPDVFQFFQKYGIHLMSGFGMTEATGGITMTPPDLYINNSLGKALPGIELKLAPDGELLVRGEYVMPGYFNQLKEETFDEDGWFPTGDIMKMDSNGFIKIIDRKKEIYKNIKGETIAPQRIENLFREFEVIKQVFVVGDHRPFNTVLIYPEPENTILTKLADDQKEEYFSNLIVTINKFLAPFERIVDFRIIDRQLDDKHGELTPKGTYKRRVIENNFIQIINELYEKDYYSIFIESTEVKIPNWFLRERGCLSGDLKLENNKIVISKLKKSLSIEKLNDNIFRIGDYKYNINKPNIELHEFLINPIYWLGNEELVAFTDGAIIQWYRHNLEEDNIKFVGRITLENNYNNSLSILKKISDAGEQSLFGLHLALVLIRSESFEISKVGFDYFVKIFDDETTELYKTATYFIDKPIISSNIEIQKQLLVLAINHTRQSALKHLLIQYLKFGSILFDSKTIELIVNNKKCADASDLIDEILNERIQARFQEKNINETVIPVLMELLVQFGIRHPTKYEDLRRKLVYNQLIDDWPELSKIAQSYRTKMRNGFRRWLGENEIVAVDIETGDEYGWDDVIIYEDDISIEERNKLSSAISSTPILREAIFLFSKGNIVRLSNILPRGVWISIHYSDEKVAIFRVSVQTRHQGSFDILFHLDKKKSPKEIKAEVNWLILAGSRHFLTELVEDFGGFWEQQKIWTQKYLPGLTVAQLFARDVKKDIDVTKEKYYYLWPFFIWNASAAYINFWRLTSGRLQLEDPSPENIIIPSHDYQLGTRFVSLSNRSDFVSFKDLFFNFYNKFILPIEEKYPFVKRDSAWKYVFPGLINAEGQEEGIEILNYFLIDLGKSDVKNKDEIISQIKSLVSNVEETGYIPKQLYFAVKRFLRWFKLNKNASIGAQAQMLNELYETYNLIDLENYYPETRTRFYLETVFKNSGAKFRNTIRKICNLQHDNNLSKDEFMNEISRVQNEFKLSEKETYFMARLSYPHLSPSDSASFILLGSEGEHSVNLVVQVEDQDGNPFYIRKPVSPKEISKLYQLFLDANLQVSFKPNHNFLVAISDRGFIIGGLYYSYIDNEVVHMEKIVVSNRFRRRGVSEIIMKEFFNRMKDEGFKFITTGFFRPEYFYRFDFKIEKKYSGLVKQISE